MKLNRKFIEETKIIKKTKYTKEIGTYNKNWRLIQLMTALEEISSNSQVSAAVRRNKIDSNSSNGSLKAKTLTDDHQKVEPKSEVLYKNVYITNPLIPTSSLMQSISEIKGGSAYAEKADFISDRFPIKAKFVAQWLSENIVSSKTYKLSLLCDRVIKAAKPAFLARKSKNKNQSFTGSVNLVGIKIIISGRILGAEIATSKTFKAGQIPSNTIDILKDVGFALAKTRSGTIGIKVTYFWKKAS